MRSILINVLLCVFFSPLLTAAEPVATIAVDTGEYARTNTPVSVELEKLPIDLSTGLLLQEVKGSRQTDVPSQIDKSKSGPAMLCWILSGDTPAGGKRIYELVRRKTDPGPGIEIITNDKALEIHRGGKQVVRYNHALVEPPDGADRLFVRSGFIHPLWSPSGEVLSRIHPADHIHHLGLWHPWTKTKFEGKEIDFWNLRKGQGTVRFVKFNSKIEGAVFGGFEASQDHIDLTADGGEQAVLNDKLDVRVWNTPDKAGYLMDHVTTQRCATDEPLYLDAYRYGGFGFRATEKWKGENRNYLTSEGKTLENADGSRARWCIASGSMGKKGCGVLFMGHPANREYPEPIRVWGKGFGEVFFNFCPIKKKPWELKPGKDHVLRYRIYVYDGNITANDAERLWQDFAHPPKAVLTVHTKENNN